MLLLTNDVLHSLAAQLASFEIRVFYVSQFIVNPGLGLEQIILQPPSGCFYVRSLV